jgi:hypothetical protein
MQKSKETNRPGAYTFMRPGLDSHHRTKPRHSYQLKVSVHFTSSASYPCPAKYPSLGTSLLIDPLGPGALPSRGPANKEGIGSESTQSWPSEITPLPSLPTPWLLLAPKGILAMFRGLGLVLCALCDGKRAKPQSSLRVEQGLGEEG